MASLDGEAIVGIVVVVISLVLRIGSKVMKSRGESSESGGSDLPSGSAFESLKELIQNATSGKNTTPQYQPRPQRPATPSVPTSTTGGQSSYEARTVYVANDAEKEVFLREMRAKREAAQNAAAAAAAEEEANAQALAYQQSLLAAAAEVERNKKNSAYAYQEVIGNDSCIADGCHFAHNPEAEAATSQDSYVLSETDFSLGNGRNWSETLPEFLQKHGMAAMALQEILAPPKSLRH